MCVAICAMVLPEVLNAQDFSKYDDVIYGTDGSIVRGTIIEQVPGVSYKIATRDGNVFVYDALKVEKITKEAPINNYYSQQNSSGRHYDESGKIVYRKSPFWSAFGSFWIPGLGQVINGQFGRGVLCLGAYSGSAALLLTGGAIAIYNDYESNWANAMMVIGTIGFIGSYFYSLIQAPIYASKWNAQNGFALGGNKWLNVEPSVGVSNNIATGSNATYGMKAVLTF